MLLHWRWCTGLFLSEDDGRGDIFMLYFVVVTSQE